MEWLSYILFAVIFLMTQVYENYYRERERFELVDLIAEKFGRYWHTHQFMGWGLVFGMVAGLLFGGWTAVKVVALTGASWWIVYDGWLNLIKGRVFFYQSKQSTSTLEKIAHPVVKIGLLIGVIALMLLAGCSPAVRYVESVRVDTVTVVPPVIVKEIPAQVITDTVIVGYEVIHTDTVVTVKYLPREQKFELKVKPDTIRLIQVDTVTKIHITEKEAESEWYETWWIWAIAVGVMVFLIVRKKL